MIDQKYDLILAHTAELQLSISDAVALHDHMRGVKNIVYHLRPDVETYLTLLKEHQFMYLSIDKYMPALEREGIISSLWSCTV